MTYSSLIDKTMSTKKRSSRLGKKISRVIVHHWAGTAGGVARLVHSTDQASANYIILTDGTLIGSVDEKYRAWTSGSGKTDRPSVTVEVQNETGSPEWRVSDAAIRTLTNLIADVAKRHGWSSITRNRVRGHREFAATACPGPHLYPKLATIAANAETIRAGGSVSKPKPKPTPKPEPEPTSYEWPDNALRVDGDFGPITRRAYQRLLAPKSVGNYTGKIDADIGPLTVRAEQRWLKGLGFYGGYIDGDRGPLTRTALQRFLASKGLYRGRIDAQLGPMSVKALQEFLNDQRKYY